MENNMREDGSVKKRIRKAKFGIKKKLLVFIIPTFILAIGFIIIFTSYTSQISITNKTQELIKAEGRSTANMILAWQKESIVALEEMTDAIINLNMTDEEILAYLAASIGAHEDYPNGMYITYDNAKVLDGAGWVPEGVATEGLWYQEGLDHESFAFGTPYLDEFTNEYVVTASRRIEINGQGAVAAADVSLSILTEIIKEMQVADTGDAFIADKDTGIILAHKEDDLAGTVITDASDEFYKTVYDDILADNTEESYYESSEGTYMSSMLNIEGTSWYMVCRVLKEDVLKDLYKVQRILITVGIVMLLGVCIMVERLTQFIAKPVKRLTATIVKVTDGDFTADIKVKGHDEVAVMAASVQQFLAVMQKTLGKIIGISNRLGEKAENSNELSKGLYQSATSQSESMNQLNTTVEELVRAITEIAQNATSLAQIVSDTSKDGLDVVDKMGESKEAASDGKTGMDKVNSAMGRIEGSMGELNSSIKDVGAAAVKIDEIIDTISNIAEETNLLALNASIEAARAGDAGRGFAVVAAQIKKLAETSQEAAKEISGLIHSVTGLIHSTVEKSETSMAEIKESAGFVNTASSNFNRIYESINSTNIIVDSMIDKIRQVDDVASSVAAITQEQSASAEEIEATSFEITNHAHTVTDNSKKVAADSEELEKTAEELREQISQFKI